MQKDKYNLSKARGFFPDKTFVLSLVLCFLMIVFSFSACAYYFIFPKKAAAQGIVYWNGVVATGFAGGEGTEDEPYQISNGAELAYFAELINSGDTQYNSLSRHYILTDDIYLNESGSLAHEWTPIGSATAFLASFDGAGFSVKGIYINDNSSDDYKGLFGTVGSAEGGAEVKNTTVEDSLITGHSAGGIAGALRGAGRIINCSNGGTISGRDSMGGIAGLADGGSIINCFNFGSISGASAVGGIAGRLIGGTTVIANCYNEGTVSSPYATGGLVGYMSGGSVTNSFNTGMISSADASTLGAIAGYFEGDADKITYSYFLTAAGISAFGAGTGTVTEPTVLEFEGGGSFTAGGSIALELTANNLLDALNLFVLSRDGDYLYFDAAEDGKICRFTNRAWYIVYFSLNGGTGTTPPPQFVGEGDKLTVPAVPPPTLDNRIFLGWSEHENGIGLPKWDFDNDVIEGETAMYAKWGEKSNSFIVVNNASPNRYDILGKIKNDDYDTYPVANSLAYQQILDNIKTEAGSSDFEIQFGMGGDDVLSIGSTTLAINMPERTVYLSGSLVSTSSSNTINVNSVVYSQANISNGSAGGAVQINNGAFIITGGAVNAAITNNYGCSFTISGGTVNAAVTNNYGGSLTVSGGTVNAVIINNNGGSLTISGGTINAGINNYGDSLTISGGTIYGEILNDYSTMTVSDGIIFVQKSSGDAYGIINTNEGSLTVSGGEIRAESSGGDAYGISNSGGSLTVSGGEIHAESSSGNAYGTSSIGGSLTVSEGMITASVNDNGAAYGIYIMQSILTVSGGSICAEGDSSYGIFDEDFSEITISDGSVSGGFSVYSSVADGSVVFSGNPDLSGKIYLFAGTLSLSASFNPSQGRRYNLSIADIAHNAVAVSGGAEYLQFFTVDNELFRLDTSSGNIVLIRQYTVTFVFGDGTADEEIRIDQGTTISQPLARVRAQYMPFGWWQGEEFSSLWDFESGITADLTLYLKWLPKAYDYVIKNADSAFEVFGKTEGYSDTYTIYSGGDLSAALSAVLSDIEAEEKVCILNFGGDTVLETGNLALVLQGFTEATLYGVLRSGNSSVSGSALMLSGGAFYLYGEVENTSGSGNGIYGSGSTLYLESGASVVTAGGTAVNLTGGNLYVNAGVSVTAEGHGIGISNGNIEIDGASVTAKGYALYSSNGNGTISNAALTSTEGAAVYVEGGSFTITDTAIDAAETALHVEGGNLVLQDSVLQSAGTAIQNNGTLTLSGASVAGDVYALISGEGCAVTLGGMLEITGIIKVFSDKLSVSLDFNPVDNVWLEIVSPSHLAVAVRLGAEFIEHFELVNEKFYLVEAETDVKLFAQYFVSFSLDFVPSPPAPENQTVDHGGRVNVVTEPERTGYMFGGWWTKNGAEFLQEWDFNADTVTADVTLFARWCLEVAFDSKGGSTVEKQVIYDGGYAVRPANPVRTGFDFKGWWRSIDGGNSLIMEYTFSLQTTEIVSGANLTLYAKWEATAVTLAGNFSAGACGVLYSANLTAGCATGGSFTYSVAVGALPQGLTLDGSTGAVSGTPEKAGNFNFTVRALNTASGATRSVAFSISIGKGQRSDIPQISVQSVTKTSVTLSTAEGVEYSKDGTVWQNSSVFEGLAVNTQYTFYARYKESENYFASTNSQTVQARTENYRYYSITFDSNGGSSVAAIQNIREGLRFEPRPADPQREGYVFAGWFLDAALTTAFNWNTTASGDLTLYAKWEDAVTAITVKITYIVDGSVYSEDTILSGSSPSRPADPPQSAGRDFAGWYIDASFSRSFNFSDAVFADITLYAKFTEQSFELMGSVREEGGNPAAFAEIYFKSGNTTVYYTITDWEGRFVVGSIPKGMYNIVIMTEGGIVKTEMVTISDAALNLELIVPSFKTNSLLEISSGSRDILVGGINGLHSTQDKQYAQLGVTVEYKVKITEKAEQEAQDARGLIAAALDRNQYAAGLFELKVYKSYYTGTGQSTQEVTALWSLLKLYIPLVDSETGQENYFVMILDGTGARKISTVPNSGGEYFELDDEGGITVYLKGTGFVTICYEVEAEEPPAESSLLIWLTSGVLTSGGGVFGFIFFRKRKKR